MPKAAENNIEARVLERIKAAEQAESEAEYAEPTTAVLPTIRETSDLAIPVYEDRAHTLDQSDIAMPRIRLGQAMSAAVQNELVKKGQWYLSPDNSPLGEEIDVVLLNMFKHLAYFEPGSGLMCRSYDLVQGVGDPGIECAICPLSKWPPREVGGSPKCGLYYNYTALILRSEANEDDEPLMGILSLGRTSTSVAKQINSFKSTRAGLQGPWYKQWYRLGSKRTENKMGIFHTATVKFGGKVEGDMLNMVESQASFVDESAAMRSLDMEGND